MSRLFDGEMMCHTPTLTLTCRGAGDRAGASATQMGAPSISLPTGTRTTAVVGAAIDALT